MTWLWEGRCHMSFFFSVRCRLVIFEVPSGRWTAPSGVGRWLFLGVCFLGNFLLGRYFLFCGEGMAAGHGLWFVLPVRAGKWLTFQCQSFSCGYAVCSGLFFIAGISWSGIICPFLDPVLAYIAKTLKVLAKM